MKVGMYKEVADPYWAEMYKLAAQIDQIKRDMYKALNALEKQCVKEHGSHLDDNGFMFGQCVRCGANLG